jgi:isoleucyl-tRNA synthetase
MTLFFKEYQGLNLYAISLEILQFWIDNDIFKKSVNIDSKSSYVFYEGPPSVNGKPGVHHIMSKTIKDIFCRYHSLQGKKVLRSAGWDAHGLPIELTIEKKFNIKKKEIGKKISVKDYNSLCCDLVNTFIPFWVNITKKMGFWLDTEFAYKTSDTKYIESVWYIFKQLFIQGLIYKSYSIQPYSPLAGTALSSHELNLPGAYKEVIDPSIMVLFELHYYTLPEKLKKFTDYKIYLLVWTTTPWTLPANSAIAVKKDLDYVVILTYNIFTKKKIYVIIAYALIKNIFIKDIFYEINNLDVFHNYVFSRNRIPYLILDIFKGIYLLNIKYYQLLEWVPVKDRNNIFYIIHSNHVNMLEGTGLVHISPTFGVDDYLLCKNNNIPSILITNKYNEAIPIVDLEGKYSNCLPGSFAGRYIKEDFILDHDKKFKNSVDQDIINLLIEDNKLFYSFNYKHMYPHCWRTNKPIIYYPLNCWFLKASKFKFKFIEYNKRINWVPSHVGDLKFNSWLHSINDWNLSRSRFWGTPIPIWKTRDNKEIRVIGSIEELMLEVDKSISSGFMIKNPFKEFVINDFSSTNYSNINLHRENLDNIVLTSDSGQPMMRENDVLDVWFDSGCMPYASIHYPFENVDLIDDNICFPADFIAEGVDQTRGWFYTLHVISSILFKSVAFKNVVSNGLVLDKEGNKMSKSKGNTIDPEELLNKYSPDLLRWYMVNNSNPWDNLKFKLENILEIEKKFFDTLYNVYSFFVLYANIDEFNYIEDDIIINNRHILDQWILSELHILIKNTVYNYEAYNIHSIVKDIRRFVIDNLSNWYVRLSRKRVWKNKYDQDKISCYQTLYMCIINIAKIASPISPFFMDKLYRDLNNVTSLELFNSVHLCKFPLYNNTYINTELSHKMFLVQKITSLVLSLRKKHNIRVRQPLNELIIITNDSYSIVCRLGVLQEWILKETNIKRISFFNYNNNPYTLKKTIKINYKILGPKLGNKIKFLNKELSTLTNQEVLNFENSGFYIFNYQDVSYTICSSDVYFIVSEVKDWRFVSYKDLTIFLDIRLNQKLIEEGFVRDVVNRLQFIRKKHGFNITDNIIVYLYCETNLEYIFIMNQKFICKETLSKKILLNSNKILSNNIEYYDIQSYNIGFYIKKHVIK